MARCILHSSCILGLNVGGCGGNGGSRVVTGVEILDGECGEILMALLVGTGSCSSYSGVCKVAGVLMVENGSGYSFCGVSVDLWRRVDSSVEESGDGH